MVVKYTLENIETAAHALINQIENHTVIVFHGEMGAGKTTLIQALCKLLGVKQGIGSPTFSIINEYRGKDDRVIYHMDLYRLKDEEEAMNAGIEDAILSGNLCLVEWPEKAPEIFPDKMITCYITSIDNNTRKLQINS